MLIPVLGRQPAGDVSHKPGGRLPLISARPAVTPATLKRAATIFAAWWTEEWWVWTVCLRLLPSSAPESSTRICCYNSVDLLRSVQFRSVCYWEQTLKETDAAARVYSRLLFLFWGKGNFATQNLQSLKRLPNCVLINHFLTEAMNYEIHHGNFLLMDNKHNKLFIIKQSKWCKFMLKMHQNIFGVRALPRPAGGAYMLPRHPCRNGGLLLRGGREIEGGRGPTSEWS